MPYGREPPYPYWMINETYMGPQCAVGDDNSTGLLVIKGNETHGTVDLRCDHPVRGQWCVCRLHIAPGLPYKVTCMATV